MRVAIIGSGPSGLIAAKYCLTSLNNLQLLDIYDRLPSIGGLWCEDTKHSALYDNLRTNLPKEIMEFEGLHYEINTSSSFITAQVVRKYLQQFTNIYQIEKHIKFEMDVINISRLNDVWQITARHLPTNQELCSLYDAVIVCNGHFNVPEIPNFIGLDEFQMDKGKDAVIHSKTYRTPTLYQDKDVLVIGGGPSGQDITIDLSSTANKVYFSHHLKKLNSIPFTSNIIVKPDIKCFTKDGVLFMDGTSCKIDRVILATGYRYNMDFLDRSCGVGVEEHGYVRPLHKHITSIHNPTLVFIGLPFRSFLFPLFELQAKCIIQLLNGNVILPSVDIMMKQLSNIEERNEQLGISKKKYHFIGNNYEEYMEDLATFYNVEPIKKILFHIFKTAFIDRLDNLLEYRDHRFTIIDEEHFEKIKVK